MRRAWAILDSPAGVEPRVTRAAPAARALPRPAGMSSRCLLIAVPIVLVPGVAIACPEASADEAPHRACRMALDRLDHILDVEYAVGTHAVAATGGGSRVDTSIGADLGYTAQLGSDEQPEYELGLTAGVTAHRIEGAGSLAANGIATRAALRFGPAPLVLNDTTDRFNAVWFPFGFELAHDGDLAQLPRLSRRPDLRRAVFGREHVSLATRLVRVEMSGDSIPADKAAGPGARTPESSALDVIALRGELEATMQDGTRLEAMVGGDLVAGVGRSQDATIGLLGYEHRAVRPLDGDWQGIGTFWFLRAEWTEPHSGTRYFIGWGTIATTPNAPLFRALMEMRDTDAEDDDEMSVGGFAWYWTRPWGTVGFQFRRDPFISMAGEPGVEDRLHVEAVRPGTTRLASRWFVARTLRLVGESLREDITTGLEVDASREIGGFDVALRGELGRTFYAAVDDGAPEVGFAAHAALSISRRGGKRWTR